MKRRFPVFVFLAFAAVAMISVHDAQATTLDVGVWGGGGCCDFGTRGYWFVAPIDFTITQLSIPGNGDGLNSTLEVVRLLNTPPFYPSATNDFTSLGYWAGSPDVNTSIAIQAGDIVGVLGWRDEFTPYLSGYGDYSTTLGGYGIVLTRFGFQHLGVAHDLWQEPGGPNGIIYMDYTPGTSTVPEPSTLALLGLGIVGLIGYGRRQRTL